MTTKASKTLSIKATLSTQIRARRTKARALKQRRDALIDGLARTLPPFTVSADILTGREAFVLLAGNLKGAKSVAQRLSRRALLQSTTTLPSPRITATTPEPARPTRIVAEAMRPAVLPGLVAELPEQQLLSIEDAITAAMNNAADGKPPFKILDHFRSATSLDWNPAAEMLFHAGVFRGRLDPVSVAMTASARRFWERWQLARDNYRAAVHLGQIGSSEGDWGLLEADQLDELLPEFSLPRSAIRNEWLVRLVRKPPTSLFDLDFHATTARPLFTVPM